MSGNDEVQENVPVGFGAIMKKDSDSGHEMVIGGSVIKKEIPSGQNVVEQFRDRKSGWQLVRGGRLVPLKPGQEALQAPTIAVGIGGLEEQEPEVMRDLWLQNDTLAIPVPKELGITQAAQHAAEFFYPDKTPRIQIDLQREVHPTRLVPVEVYKETDPEDFAMAEYYLKDVLGLNIGEFSSTAEGGGVAKMLHRKMDIMQQLGIRDRWRLMTADDKALFEITKGDMHNVLQGRASGPDRMLAGEKKENIDQWSEENADLQEDALEAADIIVIHDPQPAGLIKRIRELDKKDGKHRKIIYRSHIQIRADLVNTPGTPQHTTWEALSKDLIDEVDLFVTHPLEEFVPDNIPREKVVAMGATTDRFDGLNKPLSEEQLAAYQTEIDELLAKEQWLHGEKGQQPIDWDRPYSLQIARWDPSKGIDLLLEHYRQYREEEKRKGTDPKDSAQLVLAGMGATDDPDQRRVFEAALKQLESPEYAAIADDIKLLRVPAKDQLLNTLMKRCKVYVQNSTAEGFEILATEALLAGKPVVGSKEGGIKLQLQPAPDTGHVGEEHDSFLIDPHDHTTAAHYLSALLDPQNTALYERMQKAATEHGKHSKFTTMQNVVNWLYLYSKLGRGEKVEGNFADVHDMAVADYKKQQNKFAAAA